MYFSELKLNLKQAFKQNLLPGLILQCFALSIALCYFFLPEAHGVFLFFSDLRAEYGWRFATISTAIFGGFIPYMYLLLSKQVLSHKFYVFGFYILFWAYKGLEVYFVFQVQAWLFGSEPSTSSIIKKTLVDQLIYAPFCVAPVLVVSNLWVELKFNHQQWRHELKQAKLWKLTLPTVIISNWLVWVPAVAVIYSMPPMLQVPLFNIIICFFVILLASLKHKQTPSKNAS